MKLVALVFAVLCLASAALGQESRIAELERRVNLENDITAVDELDAVGRAAVSALIRLMKNENPSIRGRAAAYAAKYDEAVSAVVELTKDKDPLVRSDSISGLAFRRDIALINLFIEFTGDSNWNVREVAGRAAGDLGIRAAPYLKIALDSPNDYVRAAAARNYSCLPVKPDPRRDLIKLFHDRSPRVREAVAWVCGDLQEDEVLKALVETLGDHWARTTPGIQAVPLHYWEEGHHPEIDYGDPGDVAAERLSYWPSERAIPALLDCLRIDDKFVRYDCVHALSQFGDKKVLTALERVKKEANGRLLEKIDEAIKMVKKKLEESHGAEPPTDSAFLRTANG